MTDSKGLDKTEWTIRDAEDHAVYIMCHLDDDWSLRGPSKIGISKQPDVRLKQVQKERSGRIVMVEQFWFWRRQHAFLVEQEFHRKCANFRMDGEWFNMPPSHAVAIMDLNLKAFVHQVLRPHDDVYLYEAFYHLGLPGFRYLNQMDEFQYARGQQ